MKRITIEMPQVSACSANQCAYNKSNACHARAITVGDSKHPGCDTFCSSAHHTNRDKQIAGIGACKMENCKFNDDLECMAEGVQVGMTKSGANCMTYQM